MLYYPVPGARASPGRQPTVPRASDTTAARARAWDPGLPPGPHTRAGPTFACSQLHVQNREAPFLRASHYGGPTSRFYPQEVLVFRGRKRWKTFVAAGKNRLYLNPASSPLVSGFPFPREIGPTNAASHLWCGNPWGFFAPPHSTFCRNILGPHFRMYAKKLQSHFPREASN